MRKRGRYWYVRFQRGRKRQEVHLHTEDSTEAIAKAHEVVPNVLLGRHALIADGSGIPGEAYYRRLFHNFRGRSKQREIECAITYDQWLRVVERAGGRCELTGITFCLARSKTGFRAPFAPSVDRIDSNVGYTPANVRLVCVAVNWALSDWGAAVFDAIAFAYTGRRLGQISWELAGLRESASIVESGK